MRKFLMIIVCAENSQTRIWDCFELGNVVGRIDKSLNWLEKNTRGILKKEEKRGALVSYWESVIKKPGLIYENISWNWINGEANL